MHSVTLDRNPCVLLVETDETFAERMSLDLREAGYHTVIAYDANSAWHQACELQPAMVVVDRALSGESGLKLCRQIRSAGSRVPLLLLMARDTVEDRVACLEAGADDYFLKPYRTEPFLQMVRLYLEPEAGVTEQLRFGDLVLDLTTRRAMRGG
ncbi:MAG TPA: response regulator transcription factor, partial [Coleofasciculaceae cyanobacterium]